MAKKQKLEVIVTNVRFRYSIGICGAANVLTPACNIPDTHIKHLLSRFNAKCAAPYDVVDDGITDSWTKTGRIMPGTTYYLLNPDIKKVDKYVAKYLAP